MVAASVFVSFCLNLQQGFLFLPDLLLLLGHQCDVVQQRVFTVTLLFFVSKTKTKTKTYMDTNSTFLLFFTSHPSLLAEIKALRLAANKDVPSFRRKTDVYQFLQSYKNTMDTEVTLPVSTATKDTMLRFIKIHVSDFIALYKSECEKQKESEDDSDSMSSPTQSSHLDPPSDGEVQHEATHTQTTHVDLSPVGETQQEPTSSTESAQPGCDPVLKFFQAGVAALSEEDCLRHNDDRSCLRCGVQCIACIIAVVSKWLFKFQGKQPYEVQLKDPFYFPAGFGLPVHLTGSLAGDALIPLPDRTQEIHSIINECTDDAVRHYLRDNRMAKDDLACHIRYKITRWNEKRRQLKKRRTSSTGASEPVSESSVSQSSAVLDAQAHPHPPSQPHTTTLQQFLSLSTQKL
ncbi:hypothetical protein Pelo_4149 [Pelomyxa schiedti]|nr:hypothetical protein Pelo_4149 [Pelomyxa schiedti]